MPLPMPLLYRFGPKAPALLEPWLAGAGEPSVQELCERLGGCQCRDRAEELQVLTELLPQLARQGRPTAELERRALGVLRKFAHRKYRAQFTAALGALGELLRGEPGRYPRLEQGLPALEALALARLNG